MGFFQKISEADVFIVLDNVNYRKNYFQNRNKIKLKDGRDDWITVPVEKKATSKHINCIRVSPDIQWRNKLLNKIRQNLGIDMQEVYSHSKLIDINMDSIRWAMRKMGIERDMVFASTLGVEGSKSHLLANILRKIGATKYISGPSGKDYLDMNYFDGIEVDFFEPHVDNYYSCLYNLS